MERLGNCECKFRFFLQVPVQWLHERLCEMLVRVTARYSEILITVRLALCIKDYLEPQSEKWSLRKWANDRSFKDVSADHTCKITFINSLYNSSLTSGSTGVQGMSLNIPVPFFTNGF